MELYDAVIIGGGPAGSASARQLARGGWRVLLLERDAVDRDRVCGGFLGPEASALWQRLGLESSGDRVPGAVVTRLLLSGPGVRVSETRLPQGGGLGVSRATFDAFLRRQAAAAGATCLMDTAVRGVESCSGMYKVRFHRAQHATEVRARCVVRSDGRRVPRGSSPVGYFGCRAVFEGVRNMESAVALHVVHRGHVGLNTLPDGRTVMCAYVHRSRVRQSRGNMDRLLDGCAGENPEVARALAGARRVGDWMVCPAQLDHRQIFYRQGQFHAGDAVTMVNPLLGGGMALAMGSAVLLSDRLLKAELRRPAQHWELAERYARDWKAAYAGRVRLGEWLGACETFDPFARLVLRVLRCAPFLRDQLVRYSRPVCVVA